MSRLPHRLAAALALLVAVPHGVASAGPAPPAGDVTLSLEAQPFVLEAGDTWAATFAVAGELTIPPVPSTTAATSTTVPAASSPSTPFPSTPSSSTALAPTVEARVLAHRPVEDPAAMTAVLDGETEQIVSRLTVPVTAAPSGGGSTFQVSVPTSVDSDDSDTLVLARPGLYPLTVDLVVDGEVAASHGTFVERLPIVPDEDAESVNVAVVGAVDDPGPAPDASTRRAAEAAVDNVAASATALAGNISVRLPPSVVGGLDQPALDTLGAALAGAEVVSVPGLALDPSSAVAAGQSEAFSAELRAGEDVLGGALPDTPPLRSAWIAGSTPISAPAAAMLREPLGFDVLVFEQEAYNELEGGIGGFQDPSLAFDVDLGGGSTLPGFVVSPLSRWLDTGELEERGMSAVDGAVALLGELLVWRREFGDDLRRSVVLELPERSDPDVLRTLASLIEAVPDVSLATLSTLPASTDTMELPGNGPVTVTLPEVAGVDLTARVERINLARLHAAGAGSMLIDQTQAATWDASLDELLSTSLDDEVVDARLARISAEADVIYRWVEAPRPFTLTLTGRTSTLRLNLTNTGAQDLRVVVHPTSPKLTFPNGNVPVTLAAGSVTEVLIEVEARTNGTSSIAVEVLTPVGSLNVEGPIVLTARVNALSGLGQVVTGGALLVLVSWWYGHFRRRRRIRRALLGEVDNPPTVSQAVSPDAAEATVPAPATAPATDSVSEP